MRLLLFDQEGALTSLNIAKYAGTASSMTAKSEVVVVGGGVIGITSALELQRRGKRVLVIEPNDPGPGTSAGSAGYLSDSHIFPIARSSMIRQLPKMLVDPLGPLVIRPSYAPHMVGWGLRFLNTLRPARNSAVIVALASLNRDCLAKLFELAARCGASEYLSREGALTVCRTDADVRGQEADLSTYRAYGVAVHAVSQKEMSELEPALTANVAGGIFFPDEARCADPGAFGRQLAASFIANGGSILRSKARVLSQLPDRTWSIALEDASDVRGEIAVMCAGAWSKSLLRPLGYVVPLETERGYHLMLPTPGVDVRRPLLFSANRFAATPMHGGLRLAGTAEFAGLDAPMNPRRSDILFDLAAPYLPGLQRGDATRWMGFRPNLPDSLPAIGKSARHVNLFFNFGHQHLGLTQSAVSAGIISDLICGNDPEIDVRPFALSRFS
jgi:D-amino-acid dehydrogenase